MEGDKQIGREAKREAERHTRIVRERGKEIGRHANSYSVIEGGRQTCIQTDIQANRQT